MIFERGAAGGALAPLVWRPPVHNRSASAMTDSAGLAFTVLGTREVPRAGGVCPKTRSLLRAEQLQIDAKYADAEATIILEGELDVRSVERFLACVREALEAHPGSIAVDAHGVTFMDSSGLAALLHAPSMSGHAGVSFPYQ